MNFIVAVDNNYAIGKKNKLLYDIPADLKYFKEKTLNKVVVMGENTYFSLPIKPLPKRTNIVISLNKNLKLDGCIVVNSFEELFEKIEDYSSDDVFVIGGASIYNALMSYCKYAYITRIFTEQPADVYIKNIEEESNWNKISESEMFNENNLNFKFQVFENKNTQDFNKKFK